jgi:NAD(P)-dependent dehydrogenase (short-subunit alcohol dehydrogenase family)
MSDRVNSYPDDAGEPRPGPVVLVTGVTSGLGRAIAEVYLQEGFRVVGTGRRERLGSQWAAEGRANAIYVPGDVRRSADCAAAVQGALTHFGGLDILVNNAGTVGERPVVDSRDVTDEEWSAVVDTNLTGTFFCSRAALKVMSEQHSGLILNIASINAEIGVAGMCAYNAAKAGVVQLTKTLAVEYAAHGVRVNAAVLGGVTTATLQAVKQAQAAPTEGRRRSLRMEATAVARFIVALSRADAAILTGAVIAVDNGATAGALANAALNL